MTSDDVGLVTSVPRLAPRPSDSHKGTFGRVLVVAGSRGMSGAAILTTSAVLRSGAGLVRVAIPSEIQPVVAASCPCAMTAGLPQDSAGRLSAQAIDPLLEQATWADVIAIGPGLDQSDEITSIVASLLALSRKAMVVDADGLNALAKLDRSTLQGRCEPTILTPHPGEFARLSGRPSAEIAHDRLGSARQYAQATHTTVVLKGHQSIVTDGQRAYRNTTGNPGMATGGSGDVLTGIVAAFLGMGQPMLDASVSAVWAHGRAGDLAASALCPTSLIATDLISFLPAALREIGG